MRTLKAFVVFSVLALAGCAGGTETGNPSVLAALSYTAYSSDPETAAVRESRGGVVVNAAWLVLGDVHFERLARCSPGAADSPFAPGLGVGNHASGKAVTTEFDLEEDEYCAVDVPFVHSAGIALPAEAPPELDTRTIVLQGELADGTPFQIDSGATPTVHLAAEGGHFAINDAESHVLIGFDVATWLSGLDWQTAVRVGGAIRVSEGQNASLLTSFESHLGAGVVVFRDVDGDGFLDAVPQGIAHTD